ncbi:MAG: DUF438 domain-containing protein [Desulfurococcaceae archaeon]
MSNINESKKEILKDVLRAIHSGISPSELKAKFRDVLANVSPIEIPLIEQELVKEGVSVNDILKLCDLHVELFREYLASRELQGVPRGHPVDLLMRENEWILKQAEALGVYAQALLNSSSLDELKQNMRSIQLILRELRKIRVHYRKVQMLIFPYLERRGIIAVPRVLWGREDQVITKLRQVALDLEKQGDNVDRNLVQQIVPRLMEVSSEIAELVFRENKILYPAVYALFSEGEWAAIAEIADEIGYIVEPGEKEWKPSSKPVYPYELEVTVTREQLDKLPPEFRNAIEQRGIQPESYQIRREGDIELETGYLTPVEIEGIFRSLPLELTYADTSDHVRFFSESEITGGFVRTKTILGRRIPFCHPPRLENYVMVNVEAIKKGQFKYREFWTRMGDRIIRVLIAPVKSRDGKLLGVLEIVEDLTEVVNNPEEIKRKIVVL